MFPRACRDFNFDSTSCLPSFFVAAFVAGEVVPLPSAPLRPVPDPFLFLLCPRDPPLIQRGEGICSRRKQQGARIPICGSLARFSAWVLTFKIKTLAHGALRCSALPPVGCPADPHRSWCVLRRRPAAEPSRRPSRPHFALALAGRNWDKACDASFQPRRSFLSGPIQAPVQF